MQGWKNYYCETFQFDSCGILKKKIMTQIFTSLGGENLENQYALSRLRKFVTKNRNKFQIFRKSANHNRATEIRFRNFEEFSICHQNNIIANA